jgi:TonB-linked SusC/RagA family outer membrane protein
MRKILLLSTLFFFAITSVMAQRTVSGKVTDDTGEGLPGVNVVIKGTTNGTTTDLDGNFSISVDQGATLVFSSVGFDEQEVAVGSRTVIDITLGSDVTELSEVVVTALGVERSEKALGYSVQTVESTSLVNSGATSAADALVGKAAGIQITRSSGSAGGGSRILLRGVTSIIGNNQPIIVIDGVRTNNSTVAGTEANTAGTAQSNRLMDLNVNDIESVSVLKGAAATALYGTAGSTGVIVITTKKGQKGSGLAVNFSSQLSFDKATTAPDLQSEFAQGWSGAYDDPSTGSSTSWGPRISTLTYSNDPNHPDAPGASAFDNDGNYKFDKNGFLVSGGSGPAANVYDNLGDFYRTAVTTTNSLSISGGNDVATFRFSASNHDQEGIIPNEEYLRKTASIATTLQATEALSFQATLNYTRSDHQRIQQGSNTSGLLLGLYRTPATFDNSNGFGHDAFDQPSAYIFADGAQRNYRGGGGYDNPYWTVNNTLRNEVVHRTFGSFQTSYKVSDWVNFGLNIGTDITNDDRKQNFEINSRTNPNGTIILDEYVTRQTDFYLNMSGAGQLNDDFALNYLVGVNMFSFNRHNTYTQGDGLVFGGFLDISNTTSVSAIEDDTRYRTIGFYGQVETSWRNTAFVTLGARQDYDSRLVNPANFDAGSAGFFYPSVSTAIAFTELIPANDILTFGKVRFSWAQVGAPPPNAYSTSSVYENTVNIGDGWGTSIPWPINGVTSFELDDRLGNPGLTPELTTSIEVGLDLRFLNGRISLDVAYFDQKTEDAILPATLPAETGYTSAWLNAGQLSTDGLEITLNATPVQSGDINWDTQLNFTKFETIVDELAPGIERVFLAGFNSAGSYAIKGQPYGGISGGAYLREGAGGPDDTSLAIPAGAVVINDDPTSSEYGFQAVDNTPRAIGNPNPDFILGWRNNISYKNVSLGFLLDWREGGDLWNGTNWALSFFGRSTLTAQTREEAPFAIDGVLSDGTPNNIQIVRDQSYWTSSLGGFGAIGEQFVEDGGWIRLREVSVNYGLPSSLFDGNFIKSATVGFVGRNLWYDWSYNGVDPETSLTGTGNGQGFDYFNNPSTKTWMFKLSVNF